MSSYTAISMGKTSQWNSRFRFVPPFRKNQLECEEHVNRVKRRTLTALLMEGVPGDIQERNTNHPATAEPVTKKGKSVVGVHCKGKGAGSRRTDAVPATGGHYSYLRRVEKVRREISELRRRQEALTGSTPTSDAKSRHTPTVLTNQEANLSGTFESATVDTLQSFTSWPENQ